MKIAVDAMGGDFAPLEIVLGSIAAVHEYSHMEIVLVGDETKIREVLVAEGEENNPRLIIHHASEVIEMYEHPSIALRKKKDASITVATRLVRDKVCDAVIAPGSTGAAVAAALLTLGRIKGIERPSIATPMPTKTGTTIMLDSGANPNSKPKHLVQSAIMGYNYAQLLLNKPNPTVGLLNVGEESTKGSDILLETYPMLQNLKTITFKGNVEGRDIPKGTVDVVVCDGLVGNIILKFAEGLVTSVTDILKDAIRQSSIVSKLGSLLVTPVFKKIKKRLDHTENGGAPLLGVNGVFIISHGSSKAKEIMTAIKIAGDLVDRKLIEHISKSLEEEGATKDDNVE